MNIFLYNYHMHNRKNFWNLLFYFIIFSDPKYGFNDCYGFYKINIITQVQGIKNEEIC